jgi:hypothetical protein
MRLRDLVEDYHPEGPPLRHDLKHTLSPSYIMPLLKNHDTYMQYRHHVALAAALSHERGETDYDISSTWNENQSTVCYTPEEENILRLANKLMGVGRKEITHTKSQEPDWVQKTSPVVQNTMTAPESLRESIDIVVKKL